MPSLPLHGQAVLVTGGGSGIGLACAVHLACDGADVTIVGRTEAKLIDAQIVLRTLAPSARIRIVVGDVVDETSMSEAVGIANEDRNLTICVANAGRGAGGPFTATPLEDWNDVLATNLTGTFLTFKHAATAIAANGDGSMVAISSIAGAVTHRFMTAYCVSKAAVDMLVRNIADELGPQQVRVNGVRPGLVPTDLSAGLTQSEAIRHDYLSQTPLGRLGETDDVAAMVRFLCGPDSKWITGQIVGVDGGHSLRRGPNLDAPPPPPPPTAT